MRVSRGSGFEKPTTLAVEIARHLREQIMSGALTAGERVNETKVTQALASSRSPVREALRILESEGLVTLEPHRGARVRKVSDAEAVEILQARAVLEGLAARQAAERIDAAGKRYLSACLARQRELLELGDLLGASDANADLHAALLELSGHGTAQRLIRALHSQTVRYQYRTILIPGRSAASAEEHTAIVDAVIGGRPEDAESACGSSFSGFAPYTW